MHRDGCLVSTLGIAVIGPGAIADEHMKALSGLGGVEPLWAVGRDLERTRSFAHRWSIPSSTLDVASALDDPAVDVALVCSPNRLHVEHASQALDAGKAVVLEIPMAMNASEASALVDLAAAVGRRLFVCHTMRSFEGIRHMRDLVARGDDQILQISAHFAVPRRRNEGTVGIRTWTDDLLWHHGCHLVDATLWVLGEQVIHRPTMLKGSTRNAVGMTMDLNMSYALGESPESSCIVSHSLTYNASALKWQMRFQGAGGEYVFDNGRLCAGDGETLADGASIRDLVFQDAQILDGLRNDKQTDFDASLMLPAMDALGLLEASIR